MKPIASVITTSPTAPRSATGTLGGGHGLATPASSEVAAWLGKQRPADMDAAAVSRASSHGVGLRVRYELRFPSGPNGEHLPSYSVAVGCEVDGDVAALDAAIVDLRNFMTPAPARDIEAWLAELSVIVARRADDEFGEELRIRAYAGRLGRYPADVVREVLLRQTYRFWPTWEELEKRCEAMTGPRRHMLHAMERGPAAPEPVRRAATDAERARIQALVDEMFPMRSPDLRKRAVDEALRGNCMTGVAAE